MSAFFRDIRYALRTLGRTPGFTLIAVITLAFGIGVNAAVFSVANAVLFRSLPVRQPQRIVTLWETYARLKNGGDRIPVAAASFLDWKDQNKVFESIGAFTTFSFSLTGTAGPPVKLDGVQATTGFFSSLGVKPAQGRVFLPDEDQTGKEHVAVISDGLWRRQFGSDPNLVGKSLTLTGEKYEVIGIMPPGFDFPEGSSLPPNLDFPAQTQIWVPLTFDAPTRQNWFQFNLAVIARLKPGVTPQQAQSEMNNLAENIDRTYRGGKGFGARVIGLREQAIGGVKLALLVLFGAVVLVLLIACSNVANLFLVRFSSRQRDLTLKTALGASRSELIREMLTESLLVAVAGCLLGLLLAQVGIHVLVALNTDFPGASRISVDGWVLAFALVAAVITGILSGLIPALDSSRTSAISVLKEESRTTSSGPRSRKLRNLLIVSEFGLTLVLLVSAGLLIRSYMLLQKVRLGFGAEHILTMRFALPEYKYPKPAQEAAFVKQLVQQLDSTPGIESAAVATNLPLSGTGTGISIDIVGRPVPSGQDKPVVDFSLASPDFTKALRIPLLQGRYFTDQDTDQSPPVVVINEAMARSFWPNENPIGKRLTQGLDPPGIEREIVGIVGDVRQASLTEDPAAAIVVPYAQAPYNLLFLVVRTKADPLGMVSAVHNGIQAVDPDQPTYDVKTMEQVIRDSNSQRSFNMFLLTTFASLALVLAMVGVYGVIVSSVNQRRQELGIRMALGAPPTAIRALVLKQGMLLAAIGLAIGLAAAFVVTHVMASLLYQIRATDPFVFGGATLLLSLLAVISTYMPAHQASKLEPMIVLREK